MPVRALRSDRHEVSEGHSPARMRYAIKAHSDIESTRVEPAGSRWSHVDGGRYLTDCDESTVYPDNRRMCRGISKCAGSVGSVDEPGPLPLPSRD